jgi:phospholipid/cholesterol/gamma-HCH transport system substrate-binding protein
MENSAHAMATGVFVLLLALLLAAGAFWLGVGTGTGVPYDLITESSVAGLSPGAPVRLRGVEVGEVRSIAFDPLDRRRVRVRALIHRDVRLMDGTRATISYLGLSGTAYVELDYPDSASRPLQSSEAMPARIPMGASGLAQLSDAGGKLIKTFTETLDRVNGILTPETLRNISQLISHLNQAAASVSILTRELQPAARNANHLIESANGFIQSARSTVQDADTLVVRAGAPGGAIDAVRGGALSTGQAARAVEGELVYQTLPRVDALAERFSRTSDLLNQLLQQLQSEPQSLIFGLPAPTPGPGEPGFQREVKQ